MDLNKIEKEPKIGDYVFCSRWSDRSPSDRWCVGILKEITESGYFIVEGSNRRHPNCQVINHLQGVLILGFYPPLEGSDWRTWGDRIKSLGDQDVVEFFNWFLNPPDPSLEYWTAGIND
jgi:hypothetical protein